MENLEELTQEGEIKRRDLFGLNCCKYTQDTDRQITGCNSYGIKGVCEGTCNYAKSLNLQRKSQD